MKAKRWKPWPTFSKTSFANPKFFAAAILLAVAAVPRVSALDIALSARSGRGEVFVDARLIDVDEDLLRRRLDEGRMARITWEFRLIDSSRPLLDRRGTLPEEMISRIIRRDPLDNRLHLVDETGLKMVDVGANDDEILRYFLSLSNYLIGQGEGLNRNLVRGRAHLAYRVLIPPLNLFDIWSKNRVRSAWVEIYPVIVDP